MLYCIPPFTHPASAANALAVVEREEKNASIAAGHAQAARLLVDADGAAAKPLADAALAALHSLKKQGLSEAGAMMAPPLRLRLLLETVAYVLGMEPVVTPGALGAASAAAELAGIKAEEAAQRRGGKQHGGKHSGGAAESKSAAAADHGGAAAEVAAPEPIEFDDHDFWPAIKQAMADDAAGVLASLEPLCAATFVASPQFMQVLQSRRFLGNPIMGVKEGGKKGGAGAAPPSSSKGGAAAAGGVRLTGAAAAAAAKAANATAALADGLLAFFRLLMAFHTFVLAAAPRSTACAVAESKAATLAASAASKRGVVTEVFRAIEGMRGRLAEVGKERARLAGLADTLAHAKLHGSAAMQALLHHRMEWFEESERLETASKHLVSDCLLAAAEVTPPFLPHSNLCSYASCAESPPPLPPQHTA